MNTISGSIEDKIKFNTYFVQKVIAEYLAGGREKYTFPKYLQLVSWEDSHISDIKTLL